jgi:hypothetical protein
MPKNMQDTNQEELCSPCQTDSEYEEYIITRELISALDELREENKSLKKELMKQRESVHIFEEAQHVTKNLRNQLE